MGVHVARYEWDNAIEWGVVEGERVFPIAGAFDTLAQFLENGKAAALRIGEIGAAQSRALDSVRSLGPVTTPCNIVCQGLNYGSHRAETGAAAEKAPFNLFFMKADSSLSGPYDDVIRPKGVRLLDYELEVGLIVGAPITQGASITESNLHDYVAGIVISNDVSARDVQIPQGQWFKGKSFRTFCPTGPYLYLFDNHDVDQLTNLDVRLEVNGETRQSDNTSQLLYRPAETLAELSTLMDLRPGDLIQTGTPGGVALEAPSASVQRIARFLLGEKKLMKLFVKRQMENPNYLKDGDVLRLTVRTPDGKIDLGVMETRVTSAN